MTTDFNAYVAELEARATPAELDMLNQARADVKATLDAADRKIKERERIEAYIGAMIVKYGINQVEMGPWVRGPFNFDGPCVEIKPLNCGGMRFTTLLFKAEVWGEYASGSRVSDNPICVDGSDDEEIILNFMRYIDGWISMHLLKED